MLHTPRESLVFNPEAFKVIDSNTRGTLWAFPVIFAVSYAIAIMPDFMKMGSTLFSALCAKFAVNVFFSPETISKVDDIKTKGNVIFFFFFFSLLL